MEQITIAEAMKHFNNSQSELARALGITQQAVYLWVKEDKLPPLRAYQLKDIINSKEETND